jgi:hypothetical protein
VGLAGTYHLNYPEIRSSGSLRRNGKLHTYLSEVKRRAAVLYGAEEFFSQKFENCPQNWTLPMAEDSNIQVCVVVFTTDHFRLPQHTLFFLLPKHS